MNIYVQVKQELLVKDGHQDNYECWLGSEWKLVYTNYSSFFK